MTSARKGFTLLELMIVVAIMGLLFTLVIIALNKVRRDAFNTRIQSDVRQLRALAESAYDSNGASYINWSQVPAIQADVITILNDIDDAHGNAPGAPYLAQLRETEQGEFCVSAPLHSANGGYSCVDARGVFVTTNNPCPAVTPLLCP